MARRRRWITAGLSALALAAPVGTAAAATAAHAARGQVPWAPAHRRFAHRHPGVPPTRAPGGAPLGPRV